MTAMMTELTAPASAAGPTVPYLISFPRTGSHWLRCFLELYFDRPLLTRSFFPHESREYLLLHRHDYNGEESQRRDTLYLYRGVVNTVFSELTYHHGAAAVDLPWEQVEKVAQDYRRHLRKWLVDGAVAKRRHVVAYEWLLDRPYEVLPGVIEFLGGRVEVARVREIWPRVTHEAVAEKTTHDPKVVPRAEEVALRRELFRYRFGLRVGALFRGDAELFAKMDPALTA